MPKYEKVGTLQLEPWGAEMYLECRDSTGMEIIYTPWEPSDLGFGEDPEPATWRPIPNVRLTLEWEP